MQAVQPGVSHDFLHQTWIASKSDPPPNDPLLNPFVSEANEAYKQQNLLRELDALQHGHLYKNGLIHSDEFKPNDQIQMDVNDIYKAVALGQTNIAQVANLVGVHPMDPAIIKKQQDQQLDILKFEQEQGRFDKEFIDKVKHNINPLNLKPEDILNPIPVNQHLEPPRFSDKRLPEISKETMGTFNQKKTNSMALDLGFKKIKGSVERMDLAGSRMASLDETFGQLGRSKGKVIYGNRNSVDNIDLDWKSSNLDNSVDGYDASDLLKKFQRAEQVEDQENLMKHLGSTSYRKGLGLVFLFFTRTID